MSTYYTGSLGFGLRRPCRFCDGSSSEYSQILLAPQLTSWCTIFKHSDSSTTMHILHVYAKFNLNTALCVTHQFTYLVNIYSFIVPAGQPSATNCNLQNYHRTTFLTNVN